MSKPRVIKDYDKIDETILQRIKLKYPYGFEKHLITFKNAKKHLISALPFESDDFYYLVRMTRTQAQTIVRQDEDYDENGELKSVSRKKLEKIIEDSGALVADKG